VKTAQINPKVLVIANGALDANMMMLNNIEAIQSVGFEVVTATWDMTGQPVKTKPPGLEGFVFRYPYYRSTLTRVTGYILWQVFLMKVLHRVRPHVVHSLNSPSLPAILALKPPLKYRVVLDFRDSLGLMLSCFRFPLPQAFTLYERLCARLSDHLMGCQGDNNRMREYLGPWALRGRKIANVLCVPNFRFPVEPVPFPEGKFIINISGHVTARRGAFLALEAFGGHEDTVLEFIGDIPKQKGIVDAIARCTNAVHVGKLSHEEYVKRLQSASLVWLYYDISMESVAIASSCKMFEAMAVGRPYLTSAGSWMGTVAERHGLGFTLPYGDKHAVRRLVDELIINPERVREAGRRGRETYLRYFTWDKARQAIINMYADIRKQLGSEA
jgi:glycosyltransferase involved in cell wall biosynthesis